MGWLFTLLVVVCAAVWLIRKLQANREPDAPPVVVFAYAWRVQFDAGSVADVHGKVPRNVLHAFADIAARASLTGEVRGSRDDRLQFSATIPEGVQQQLRNAYFAAKTVH